MKKRMFALMLGAVILSSVSPLFAEGMVFGIKGGSTMATGTGEDAENLSMKTGAAGGVFMCYRVTRIFGIQPELLLVMKGAKDDGWRDINNNAINASMMLNYFEIPLLLKVNIPLEGKIEPSLYSGPALGILMSAREKIEGESVDIKGLFKSIDIGIIVGAGVGYEMGKGSLILEVRYEIGMSTVMDLGAEELAAEGLTAQPDVRNSVSSIMIGYGFAF